MNCLIVTEVWHYPSMFCFVLQKNFYWSFWLKIYQMLKCFILALNCKGKIVVHLDKHVFFCNIVLKHLRAFLFANKSKFDHYYLSGCDWFKLATSGFKVQWYNHCTEQSIPWYNNHITHCMFPLPYRTPLLIDIYGYEDFIRHKTFSNIIPEMVYPIRRPTLRTFM